MSTHVLNLPRASEISSAQPAVPVAYTASISQVSIRNRIFGVTAKLCGDVAEQLSKLVRVRHRQQNGAGNARANRAERRKQAREARHTAMAVSSRFAMPKLRQITRALSAPTGAAGLIFAASIGGTTGAQAQSFVNVCTGLSVNLPTLTPVTSGVLGALLLPLSNLVDTNIIGALSGKNLNIGVLGSDGKIITSGNCAITADTIQVTANKGISFGGGQISGLGGTGNTAATANDTSAIAIGNGAVTSVGALNAIAVGSKASVTASGGIAMGNGASSTFANSVAIGTGTKAPGSAVAQGVIDFRSAGNPNQQVVNAPAGTLTMTPSAVAVGENSVVNTGGGVALGYNNNAGSTNGFFSTAIGANNLASGGYASAIGVNNTASGGSAITLGVNNTASGIRTIAIGRQAIANADYGIAQGFVASAYGVDSIAIGKNSVAGVSGGTVTDDVALGPNASATAGNSVALGSNSTAVRPGLGGAAEVFSQTAVTSTNGEVSVGVAGGERQITNVAGGTQATDAVNLRQLSSVANNVATTLGSTFDPVTGAYTAPNYTVAGKNYNTVTGAIAALNATAGTSATFVSDNTATKGAAVATGQNASAGGYGSSATGKASTVVGNSATDNATANSTVLGNGASVAATATGSNVALGQGSTVIGTAVGTPNATIGGTTYAFAGTAPAGTVSVGTAGAERTITNVAAGRLSTTSTDAVNGSQLNATNQQVGTNTTNITNIINGNAGPVQRTATAGQVALIAPTGTGAAPGTAQNLTNVANGAVNATSVDAVNGSQLFGTAQSVSKNFGGGSTVNADGSISAPAYNVAGGSFNNVGSALTALDNGLSNGKLGAFVSDNTGGKAAASATGQNASAGGFGAVASGKASTVIGNSALDNGVANSTVLGSGATVAATATGSNVALGQGSTVAGTAVGTPSATIGGTTYAFAGTAPAGTVSVGAAGAERTITNVAAGRLSTTSTDAVNGSQLNATNQQVGTNTTNITNIINGNAGPVQRTATAGQVALIAPTGTGAAPGTAQNLTNLANGAVNATSVDAVNGSQLFGTAQSVSKALGGNSTVGTDGTVGAPSYKLATGTYTDVGSALAAIDNGIINGKGGAFVSDNTDGKLASSATGQNASAGGFGAVASGNASTVVGNSATDNATANSTVLGNGASVAAGLTGSNVALGQGSTVAANAVGTPSAVIGGTTYAFAGTAPAGTVSVGAAGAERTITNVAAGRLSTTSTDAVNGSQLNATNQQVGTNTTNITNIINGNAGPVQRTATAGQVALIAPTGTGAAPGAAQNLTNVANGAVGAASTDAVNGSQLFGTAQSVSKALGGGSTVNADGTVGAPSYKLATGTYTDVGSALASIDNGVINGKVGAFVSDNTAGKAASSATGANASAGGFGAVASGAGSTVVGNSALDNGVANSTVLGSGASITTGLTGSNVALGQGSVASTGAQANYTAFGLTPLQNSVGTVSVGAAGAERTLSNVAAGKATTDAVNVAQLSGAASNLGSSVAGTIGGGSTYDTTTGKVTGGFTVNGTTYASVAAAISGAASADGVVQRTANPNQVAIVAPGNSGTAPGAAQNLTNVANGTVGAASTDAVNGSQLFGTAQSVATNLGGGSKANADGTVSAPSYTVAGNTYGNVGDALAAGNKAAVQYTTDAAGNATNAIDLTKGGTLAPVSMTGLANATTATGAVTLGQLPVQYTDAAGTPTPATPSNTVGLVGATAGTPVTLGNLAAGAVNATSTQAVNGSQLFGTAQSVSTALGGGSTVNADGTVAAPSYKLATGTYTDVGSALTAIDNGVINGKVGAFVSDNTAGKAASSATGANASAGGFGAVASGAGSTVVGNSALDNGVANSTVLGSGASITTGLTGSNVALGQGSVASTGAQANYTAFGLTPLQNAVGTVSVGAAGAERTISNVAAGKANTDAVNVAQLSGAASNLGTSLATTLGGGSTYDSSTGKVSGGFTVNGTTYTDVASAVSATAASGGVIQRTGTANQVALIAAGGSGTAPGATQNLTNLAAGTVGATSTDAVNGAQLFGTAQSVSTALGGGSKVNSDGSVSAPTYKLATGSYTDVGSALTALDNGISNGKLGAFVADNTAGKAQAAASGANASAGGFGAVASGAGSTSIGNSAVDNGVANSTVVGSGASITAGLTGSNVALGQGSVASTGARSNYSAFGLATPQNAVGTVSVGGVGAERTISNVAAGVDGTDAVNVAQLTGATQKLGGSIATSLGGGATYNATTGAITGPTYTVGGKTYNDVGSAISAGNALSVQYTTDAAGNPTNAIDLTKGGTLAPVTVSGVGPGTLSKTSNDAVNGSQLYATNQAISSIVGSKGGAFVSDNTSGAAIPTATGTDASVGGFGAVASGNRSVALGNGATSSGTNSVALGAGSTDGGLANVVSVGSAGNERRVTNVAAGVNATDAANMGQLTALSARSLQYDTTATGDTNYQSVTLNPTGSGPVTIHNVAAGTALTDAVNVGQLNAASANSVQYSTNTDGTRSNTLALLGGNAAAPVTISNVAAGVAANDAVNVGQLQNALNAQYNNLAAISEYQFRNAKLTAYAGTSIALATAGIRFDDRPGKISLGIGASGYHGSAGLAIGLGGTSEDGKWRMNVSAGFSPNNQKGAAGIMGGLSYTFN